MLKLFSQLLSESITEALQDSQNAITYYRGDDARYGLQLNNGVLWLTEDPEYAKLYAKKCEQPAIFEVIIDFNKMNRLSIYDMPEDIQDDFDEFTEPSEDVLQFMRENGINYWDIESANGGNNDCIALVDTSTIISYRQLSQEEYDSI